MRKKKYNTYTVAKLRWVRHNAHTWYRFTAARESEIRGGKFCKEKMCIYMHAAGTKLHMCMHACARKSFARGNFAPIFVTSGLSWGRPLGIKINLCFLLDQVRGISLCGHGMVYCK
jgi:hypothetical protein